MTGERREEEGQETKEREQERGVPSTQAQLVALKLHCSKGLKEGLRQETLRGKARLVRLAGPARWYSWYSLVGNSLFVKEIVKWLVV